jgi:hypothetical protein
MTKTLVFLSSIACAIAASAPAFADAARAPNDASKEKRDPLPTVRIDVTAGEPVKSECPPGGCVARPPVALLLHAPKALPDPARAQSVFYMRLGEGAMLGPGMPSGPAFGMGYRMELDRVGIDAAASFSTTDITRKDKGFEGSWLKLTAQYYFAPTSDRSFYLGGGLSWGARSAMLCNHRISGSGLQAEVVGGYELLRSSTLRIFVQADATLPFYMAGAEVAAPRAPRGPTINVPRPPPRVVGLTPRFLPSMGISLGVAWGTPAAARPAKAAD